MRFILRLFLLLLLFPSCKTDDDELPIPEDEIGVFLSAVVDDTNFEVRGISSVDSHCNAYPNYNGWQISVSASAADGRKIELFISDYDQPGLYYAGAVGSRNWMYFSPNDGEDYGTIPIWWSGENGFIEAQINSESGKVEISEGNGFMEGSFEFTAYQAKDDYKTIHDGKFRIPFNRE